MLEHSKKSTEQMTLNGENKNVTRVSLLFNAQEFFYSGY